MYTTIPQLLKQITSEYPDNQAQLYKDEEGRFHPVTYRQMYSQVTDMAAALHLAGVKQIGRAHV